MCFPSADNPIVVASLVCVHRYRPRVELGLQFQTFFVETSSATFLNLRFARHSARFVLLFSFRHTAAFFPSSRTFSLVENVLLFLLPHFL